MVKSIQIMIIRKVILNMTKKINKKKTLMIAHRGLSGLEKENSLMAFVAAGQRTYYGCECDIHKTKDGKYVVIHDSDTSRVAGEAMIVEESMFEDLRKLELLGVNDEEHHRYLQIPTLEEYIETLKKYQKKAIIEFKNAFSEADVFEVLDIIKALGYLDQCIFISFGFENLLYTKKYDDSLPCQYLMVEPLKEKLELCFKHHFGLDIYFKYLSKWIIEEFHKQHLDVNCWTVNEVEDGEALVELGVDFITTNILE